MEKMNYRGYDYSNIYNNKDSRRYYLFSHIDHFRHQKLQLSKTYDNTLKETAKMQRSREKMLLNSMGFEGTPKEFSEVFLTMQKNAGIFSNKLSDELFRDEYPSISGNPTENPKEAIKFLNDILSKIEDLADNSFVNPQKVVDSKNGITYVDVNHFTSEMRKRIEKTVNSTAKSNYQKEIKDYLTKSRIRGAIGEAAVAKALEYIQQNLQLTDDNIQVTGGVTKSTGAQVKTDVQLGKLNFQSKNYQIYDTTKPINFNLHDGSINSIGKYMDDYASINPVDIDSFVMMYNNISYFSSVGGLTEDKNIEKPSATSFSDYNKILQMMKGTAALWFGNTIGLKGEAPRVLGTRKTEDMRTLANVDFFVVGGNYVVPMSNLLEKISKDIGKIKVSKSNKLNAIGPKKFYAEKMKKLYSEKLSTPYSGSLLRYGTQIGQQHSYKSVSVKLRIQAEKLKI